MSSPLDLQAFSSRLHEFMAASTRDSSGNTGLPEEFGQLSLELFALQYARNRTYGAFCSSRRAVPGTVKSWTEIPAIPAAAFKELELSCLAPGERTTVFHSSGTTEQRPSKHFHNRASLDLYESSLLNWFHLHLLPDVERRQANTSHSSRRRLLVFTPPPPQAPRSSLVHMCESVRQAWGSNTSAFVGQAAPDGTWSLDSDAAVRILGEAAANREALVILGTAFSFVQLLDLLRMGDRGFHLAPGSRVMETGGYKGRSRALSKENLYSQLSESLGVPLTAIVSEYGMSELSSQAYDSTYAARSSGKRQFQFPPWARAQVVSPETGREVHEGETGLLRIVDLANAYSVMAVQTEDLAVRRATGFELVGRAERAEPRGCSLMATG